jgi:hypothetical protein
MRLKSRITRGNSVTVSQLFPFNISFINYNIYIKIEFNNNYINKRVKNNIYIYILYYNKET